LTNKKKNIEEILWVTRRSTNSSKFLFAKFNNFVCLFVQATKYFWQRLENLQGGPQRILIDGN
jgi:hypothetical protein